MRDNTSDSLRKESLAGEKSSSERKKVSINRRKFRKKIQLLMLTSAIAGGVITAEASQIKDYITNQAKVSSYVSEIEENFIRDNIHRTNDNQNYFYDYIAIASELKNRGFAEPEIYSIYKILGEDGTNNVVQFLGEDSLEDYIQKCGCSSIKDFEKMQKKRILLQMEIDSNENQLQEMMSSQNMPTVSDEKGEKK